MTNSDQRFGIRMRTVILILVAIAAWQSRPDLSHFVRWNGLTEQTAESLRSRAGFRQSAGDDRAVEVADFGFFSIATCVRRQVPGLGGPDAEVDRTSWFGLFGRWWKLPALHSCKAGRDAVHALPNSARSPLRWLMAEKEQYHANQCISFGTMGKSFHFL